MPKNFLSVNPQRDHIRALSNFLKQDFNKKLVVVIDSLDENPYIFNKESEQKIKNLQTVVDAVVNSELLTLALGNEEDVALNALIFLPIEKGLVINKNDKIPMIELNWSPRMLENYADFVLDNLKKQQQNPCKTLPTFRGLLGDNDVLVKSVLQSLRHPRDLHFFMDSLLDVLSENSSVKGIIPFIATQENVKLAMEKAKKNMYKTQS